MLKKNITNISKKSKMIAATAFILGITALDASSMGVASAAADDGSERISSLVSAIAEKFNLSSADVQTVIEEVMENQRQIMEIERQQENTDRIVQAVTDGDLTQIQADKILEKQEELQAFRTDSKDEFESLTDEERKTKMEEHQQDIADWAKENDIPEEYMHFEGGRGHGGPGAPRNK